MLAKYHNFKLTLKNGNRYRTAFISRGVKRLNKAALMVLLWPIPGAWKSKSRRVERELSGPTGEFRCQGRDTRHLSLRRPHTHTHTLNPRQVRVCVCAVDDDEGMFSLSAARVALPPRARHFLWFRLRTAAFSIFQTGRQLVGETRKFLRRAHSTGTPPT
jgi:hypothetical protein